MSHKCEDYIYKTTKRSACGKIISSLYKCPFGDDFVTDDKAEFNRHLESNHKEKVNELKEEHSVQGRFEED